LRWQRNTGTNCPITNGGSNLTGSVPGVNLRSREPRVIVYQRRAQMARAFVMKRGGSLEVEPFRLSTLLAFGYFPMAFM